MTTPFQELKELLGRIDPHTGEGVYPLYDDWTVADLVDYILDFHRVGTVIVGLIGEV